MAYFSRVYILHDGTAGGYLHSHKASYETGSKQQQITLYPFRDENNWWTILPPLDENNGTLVQRPIDGFVRLKHNDIIRLGT